MIETGPCVVVQKKETVKDGYNALQVGFGSKRAQLVNKALKGHMAKAGKGAFEVLKEFRLDDVSQYDGGRAGHDLEQLVKATIGVSVAVDVVSPDAIERSVGKMRRIVDERPPR